MPASSRSRSAARLRRYGILPLLAVVALGCKETSTPGTSAQAVPIPTPEERFESIVETLKLKVENGDLNAMNAVADFNAPVGTPVTDAKVRVSHELTPPSAEGEPYRGVVSLTTKSTVTVVLPQPTDEESEAADAKRKARREELESNLEGVPDLDMLVAPSANRVTTTPIHEISPDESTSSFELEYRDGLWHLISELDRENEPFYAVAIEYALKRQ